MMDVEDEVHKFWSDDMKRHAHVIYNKEFKMYLVRMFEDNKLIKSIPMVSDAYGHGVTVHNERFAEDAAENWCLGYIE